MKKEDGKKEDSITDDGIIELYFMRDEKAIFETDLKYGKYLFSVAHNILHDKLDCEECLNDTYLGAWNAIPPTRPDVLKAFLVTVMRRVAVNRYHKKSKVSSIPSEMTVSLNESEEFISGDGEVDSDFDALALGGIISDFVRSLSGRRQFIFIGRYYLCETVDAIASDLDLSRSTVNKDLSAIRKELREKLESEGYSV